MDKYLQKVTETIEGVGLTLDDFTQDEINGMINEEREGDNPNVAILDGYSFTIHAIHLSILGLEFELKEEGCTFTGTELRHAIRDRRIEKFGPMEF